MQTRFHSRTDVSVPAKLGLLAFGLMTTVIALVAVWPVPRAESFIYVGTSEPPGIERHDLDGGAAAHLVDTAGEPNAIASNGKHVFWANSYTGIGRVKIDGTDVQEALVSDTHLNDTWGLDVSSKYVYWTNYGLGTIGRAKVDGSGVDAKFIKGIDTPHGVAITSKYIFWTSGHSGWVGRAKLNGKSVKPKFIKARGEYLTSITTDKKNVYWANCNGNDLGQATHAGKKIKRELAVSEATCPSAIATEMGWVFAASIEGPIFRMEPGGGGIVNPFIDAAPNWGIGSDWIRNDGNSFTIGKYSKGRLQISVPGPGDLLAEGDGLKDSPGKANGPTAKIELRLKSDLKAKLKKKGKVKVEVGVTFNPRLSPSSSSQVSQVTIRK